MGMWKEPNFLTKEYERVIPLPSKMVNKMVSVLSLPVQYFGEHPPRSTTKTTHISQTPLPTPGFPPKPNIS